MCSHTCEFFIPGSKQSLVTHARAKNMGLSLDMQRESFGSFYRLGALLSGVLVIRGLLSEVYGSV